VRTSRIHAWELTAAEAARLQAELAPLVIRRTTIPLQFVRRVAGVDIHYAAGRAVAAVVVLGLPGLEPIAQATASVPLSYPYVPGLLSFREGPAALAAIARLAVQPDVLMFDGHGLAHPRRFGIASHIGVLLDIPAIGCAKTRLIGRYPEPGLKRGRFSYLRDRGRIIGAALRTRDRVAPVFVSAGHRVSLKDSLHVVLGCCAGFRLPETTRCADRLARAAAGSTSDDAARQGDPFPGT
jgi:deoxyribonuclease V